MPFKLFFWRRRGDRVTTSRYVSWEEAGLRPLSRVGGTPTTRIGVKRIVIEVNRDLTIEQLELLDNALRQVGLIKTTKVTLNAKAPHKPRAAAVRPSHPVFRIGPDPQTKTFSSH
jgi:hypothetical protein